MSVARHQIEGGAQIIDINMDDAMLDSRQEMQTFCRYIANDPAVSRAVLMIDSSDWATILAGLKNAQGKCIVNSISLKNGEADFIRKARELRRLGAAVVVMAFDEEGQATTYERKIAIAQRAYQPADGHRFPAAGHHLRRQHPLRRHGLGRTPGLRHRLHTRRGLDQAEPAPGQDQRRREQPLVQLPR